MEIHVLSLDGREREFNDAVRIFSLTFLLLCVTIFITQNQVFPTLQSLISTGIKKSRASLEVNFTGLLFWQIHMWRRTGKRLARSLLNDRGLIPICCHHHDFICIQESNKNWANKFPHIHCINSNTLHRIWSRARGRIYWTQGEGHGVYLKLKQNLESNKRSDLWMWSRAYLQSCVRRQQSGPKVDLYFS
jgi:hypothetical protein